MKTETEGNGLIEKRKDKRFKVKDITFALIESSYSKEMGKIVNISRGGLAFNYFTGKDRIKKSDKLDIIMADNDLRIKNMPCKTVSDFEIPDKFYFSSIKMRRHCIQFRKLEISQISELDYFIRNHTIGEASTY